MYYTTPHALHPIILIAVDQVRFSILRSRETRPRSRESRRETTGTPFLKHQDRIYSIPSQDKSTRLMDQVNPTNRPMVLVYRIHGCSASEDSLKFHQPGYFLDFDDRLKNRCSPSRKIIAQF